ncbi:hypothetical protein ABGB17_36850 [Sphaerisporangium sp. B11E5]|uniref:RipA family octameric membrane protein n=1 Tax=Sphaerisporangium sp. B11E5 TaxID=3153563 RepID=UPI00325C6C77
MTSTSTEAETAAEKRDRLWEHGLHADNAHLQRGNYFLVAESMLVVAHAGLLQVTATKSLPGAPFAALVIAAFGLLLSATWSVVNHVHYRYFLQIRRRMVLEIPVYRETRDQWAGRISSNMLITYIPPVLAAIMWIILILIAL